MCADAVSVEVRTLGCKVNRSESEALAEALAGMGVAVRHGTAGARSAEAPSADVIVVNTCTVTGEADAKARKEVRRALQATDGPVVVTGCLAAVDAEGLRSLGERVVVAADRGSLTGTVASLAGPLPFAGTAGKDHPSADAPSRPPRRTRALVKIQDGCDNRCAYCIVPDARGVPRSVPTADVVARVAALHGEGAAEVVLTGVNIGRYADAQGSRDLAELIAGLAATGVRRIRVSSIEPPDLTDRLLAALADAPAIAPHLHVPLQSGSDRILAAMGRRYDSAAFFNAIARARRALPELAVTTDVIAGFPGEGEDDFAASLDFIAACGFSKLHIFRYSRRAGTPAASSVDQVSPEVTNVRAAILRELSAQLELAHCARRAGARATLLVEQVRDGVACGTTEDHLRGTGRLDGVRPGELVPVIVGCAAGTASRGYYVEVERASD